MATDFALDNNGDLVFSAGRDLMLVTGTEQIEQRIRMRLIMPAGSRSDPQEQLGSTLHSTLRYLQADNDRDWSDIQFRVHEALAPIDEIRITGIEIRPTSDERGLELIVRYEMVPRTDEEEMGTIGEVPGTPGELSLPLTPPEE